MKNNLAKNLKILRKRENLTLECMSNKLGLSGKSSYYAYEEGRAEPQIKTLIKLAKIFKVTIDTLIYGK